MPKGQSRNVVKPGTRPKSSVFSTTLPWKRNQSPGKKSSFPWGHRSLDCCVGAGLPLAYWLWKEGSGNQMGLGNNCHQREMTPWNQPSALHNPKALNAWRSRTLGRHPQSFHKHVLHCTFSFNEASIFIHLLGFVNVKIRSIITPI